MSNVSINKLNLLEKANTVKHFHHHSSLAIHATPLMKKIHNYCPKHIKPIHKPKSFSIFNSPTKKNCKSHHGLLGQRFKMKSLHTSSPLFERLHKDVFPREPLNPLQDFMRSLVTDEPKVTQEAPVGLIEKTEPTVPSIVQFEAEILQVVSENKDFKTIRVKRPADWVFLPGQYIEIRGDESAKKASILAVASSINEDYIEITAKPNNDPAHSNYCLNKEVGQTLIIKGPFGSSFPLHLVGADTPVLLLGGGSGITALKSLFKSVPQDTSTKIIYSSKTYQDIIYRQEMEMWKNQGHTISFTQDQVPGYDHGRITDYLNSEDLQPNTLVFLCGPKELVIQTAKQLVELGVSPERIYGSLPVAASEGGPVFRGDHPKMDLISMA